MCILNILNRLPYWRGTSHLIAIQAMAFSAVYGGVSAQIWNGPQNGTWGHTENWLGPVPGNNYNEPSFIVGDLVFFSGPSTEGAEKVQISLNGKTYSIGALFIETDAGVRLSDGRLILESPSNRLIVVNDGNFETANNLDLVLTDTTIFAPQANLELRTNGPISGNGGLAKHFLGTFTLNSHANSYTGSTVVLEGDLRINGNIPGFLGVDGGRVTVTGGKVEGRTEINNGTLNNMGGALEETLSNNGGNIYLEGGSYGGDIVNNLGLLSVGGNFTGGPISISNAAELRVRSPFDQGGGNLKNSGSMWLNADVNGIETLSLDGVITTDGPHVIPNLNVGTIIGSANARFDLRGDDVVGLGLNVNSNLEGALTILFPSGELRGVTGAETPRINWNGALPDQVDALKLDFGLQSDSVVRLGKIIPILKVNTLEVSGVTATGLPTATGLVTAFLQFDKDAKTFNIITAANPSLGGISNSVAVVASLLSPVIERPLGSFGTNVTSAENCNRGSWIQFTGGKTRFSGSSGTILGDGSSVLLPSVTDASYRGFEGGFDILCRTTPTGLNMLFGLTFGLNDGVTQQNIPDFTIDPVTRATNYSLYPSNPSGVIDGEFFQLYGGTYFVVQDEKWIGELQLRHERTSFDFSSSGAAALPIDGGILKNQGSTVSGQLSYQIPMIGGMYLAPLIGLGATYFSGSNLDLFSPKTDSHIGTISTKSHIRNVGFLGATISQNIVSSDGQRFSSGFLSAKYNFDFSRPWRSSFSQPSGETMKLSVDFPDRYGDLEFGVRHIIKSGSSSNSSQVQLSMTGGFKFGDRLSSNNVAVQLQVSF